VIEYGSESKSTSKTRTGKSAPERIRTTNLLIRSFAIDTFGCVP
jgi:hypothetical protein